MITTHYLYNPLDTYITTIHRRPPNLESFHNLLKKTTIEDYARQYRVNVGIIEGEGIVAGLYRTGNIYLREFEDGAKLWFIILHELTHHFQVVHGFRYTLTNHIKGRLSVLFSDVFRRFGKGALLKLPFHARMFNTPYEMDALITEYMLIDRKIVRRWENRFGIKEGTTENQYQEWFGGVYLGKEYDYLLRL